MDLKSILGETQIMNDEEREKEKIRILELNQSKINYIRNLPFKEIDYHENIDNLEQKIIEVKDIVGTSRSFQTGIKDWFDYMLKDVHKMINFNMFEKNKSNYETFLLNPSDDLPHVLELDNEYYIGHNGKHRITIAKCFGIQRIRVISSKIK